MNCSDPIREPFTCWMENLAPAYMQHHLSYYRNLSWMKKACAEWLFCAGFFLDCGSSLCYSKTIYIGGILTAVSVFFYQRRRSLLPKGILIFGNSTSES